MTAINPVRRLHFSLAILLSHVAASLCHAQIFPEDIRLSHDVEQMVLPEDARIQSAARIGDRTLVVWGSSRNVDDDSVANTLYWQMLADTVKLGEPQRLTDDRFDPFGFVQVLSLDDRFLVVWNDRRDQTMRTWSAVVDTTGFVATSEVLWGGHPLTKSGVGKVILPQGWVLVWSDTISGRIAARRMSRIGTFPEEVFFIGSGHVGNLLNDVPMRGQSLIDRGDSVPLIVDHDGAVKGFSGTVAEKFIGGFEVENDGTVLNIRNDTVFEYSSAIDTIPVRRLPCTLPTSIRRSSHTYYPVRGTEYVVREATGRIRVYFGGYTVVNDYSGPNAIAALCMMDETDSSRFSEAEVISIEYAASSFQRHDYMLLSISGNVRRFGCGTFLVSLNALIRESWTYQQYGGVDTFSSGISVVERNGDCSWYLHNHYPIPAGISVLIEQYCPIPSEAPVRRHLSRRTSNVSIVRDSFRVLLNASAARHMASVPHVFPAILHVGDSLVVASLQLGFDSTAVVGSWNVDDGTYRDRSRLSVNLPETDDTLTNTDPQLIVRDLNGAYVLHHYQPQILENLDQGSVYRTTRFRNVLYLLRPDGWKEIAQVTAVTKTHMYYPFAMARDPDDGNVVVTYGWLGINAFRPPFAATGLSIRAFSETGDSLWAIDSLDEATPSGFVVPLQQNRFVVIGHDKAHSHYADRRLLYRVPSPSVTDATWVVYGSNVVGAYGYSDAASGTVRLELMDTTGAVLSRHDEKVGPRLSRFTIVNNPNDSGIVLLYADQHIIGAIAFDKGLNLIERYRVTMQSGTYTNPSAAFRNDTLFVVWEDYRNGNPDIYANAIVPGTRDTSLSIRISSNDSEVETAGDLIASISPIPARDIVTVRLTRPVNEATRIELWNLTGNRVLEDKMQSGSSEAVLRVEELPSGAYVLVVNDGDRKQSRLVLIGG